MVDRHAQSGNSTRKARQGRRRPARTKEPLVTQIASFVDLFVWLLVLKTFFLPLFIIPTGSMAETLMGAHATCTCPNCGYEFPVGFHTPGGPNVVQCPNCRYQQPTQRDTPSGIRLNKKAGDRIVVNAWPFDIGGRLGPQRWDVVVFKNPNEPDVNYIKRLIGLPGETIEIIDGDVWVRKPGEDRLHPARKTKYAQQALWFPCFDQDYLPREAAQDWVGAPVSRDLRRHQPRWPPYAPRFQPVGESGGWRDLDTRMPVFDGAALPRREVQFVSQPGDDAPPARILDTYGYNSNLVIAYHNVTDVRLSTDVRFEGGDGYVELVISKYEDVFYARLRADGRLTLAHENRAQPGREQWGQTQVRLPAGQFVRLALGQADYAVAVEFDGRTVLASSRDQYPITAAEARNRSRLGMIPTIRIAAARVSASFAHVRIDRDIYYTSGNLRDRTAAGGGKPGTGTQGHPITLKDDAYFVCGDNSPASLDSRAWSARSLGLHLRKAYEQGRYDIGTVPASQMIGRAFFVYWPGFLPLTPGGPNLLPDIGRVRWIH